MTVDAAWRTRVLVPFSLLRRMADDVTFLIVGVAKWMSLALPVDPVVVNLLYKVRGRVQDLGALFNLTPPRVAWLHPPDPSSCWLPKFPRR